MNINFSRLVHDGREFLIIGRLTLLPNTPFDRILDFQEKIERVDQKYENVYDAESFSSWTGISETSLDDIRVGGEKDFYEKEIRVIRVTAEFFVGIYLNVNFNYNYNFTSNEEENSLEEYEEQLIYNY